MILGQQSQHLKGFCIRHFKLHGTAVTHGATHTQPLLHAHDCPMSLLFRAGVKIDDISSHLIGQYLHFCWGSMAVPYPGLHQTTDGRRTNRGMNK